MDEDQDIPATKKYVGSEREVSEPETRYYSGLINGSSSSQRIMEDKMHFHTSEINHKNEGCEPNTQNDENRLPGVKPKSGEHKLDIERIHGENNTIEVEENNYLQLSANAADTNIYDETKPRRLRHSKIMQQDEADSGNERLRQSIDVLISPDEQPHRSPTRRKGVSGASYQYIETSNNPFFPPGSENDMTDHTKRVDSDILHREQNKYIDYHGNGGNRNERMEYKLDKRDDSQDKSITSSLNGTEAGCNSDSESETDVNDSVQHRNLKHNKHNVDTAMEDGARYIEQSDTSFTNEHFIPIKHIKMDHDTIDQQTGAYMKRSKSSNDMLSHKNEPVSQVARKTSADANLESERRYDSDQEFIDSQTQRKRRVSFGTFAYVKRDDSDKHETSPLNDELRLPSTKRRTVTSKAVNVEALPDKIGRSAQKAMTERIPTIYLSEDDEDEANEKPPLYLPNGNGSIPKTKQGCDNLAYAADENDYGKDNLSETVSQDYDSNYTKHSHEGTPRSKKISTQSLPAGVGVRDTRRSSWHSDDSSMPKSILKNKAVSSESLASSAGSANDKRFRVRKDSIALFTDKHGQVGLLEIKKDSTNWKEKLSIKKLWSKRSEVIQTKKTHLFVFGVFSCILAFVIVGLHLHNIHKENLAGARKVVFDAKARQLHLYDIDGNDQISGTLALDIPSWMLPIHCHEGYDKIHDSTCLIWKQFGTLKIRYMDSAIKCYNISWAMEPGVNPKDCFDIGNDFWYGPSNSSGNNWPINMNGFKFDTNSVKHFDSGTFEFVTEYYWLATNGAAIYVDTRFPLQVSWNQDNNGKMCLSVEKSGDFYETDNSQQLFMNYVVCNGENILKTHNFIGEQFISNLQEIPDIALMTSPHWSTDAEVKKSRVNETTVLDLTRELKRHNLSCSTIELDGQWEGKIGDFTFSKIRFPNITETLQAAESVGCELSLILFPYFDLNSRNFAEGLSRELFIKSIGNRVPALVKWQFGIGPMLDVSNSSARNWFSNKIRKLKSLYNINTFRFAYGNSFWLPHRPVFSHDNLSPNKVKTMFSDLFSSFGDIVMESTSRSQHVSGFIGIPTSVISHRESKCLNNIIADALNLGNLGYPLVMSDGFELNISDQSEETFNNNKLPSRDLFIRWIQLSAFFPAMRYTVKPWDYDKEVINIARHLSNFHREAVLPEINKLRPGIRQGKPIIRPLWWQNPKDRNTFKINDQFLLGDKFLVAPVLCEGTDGITERDIYVPKGIWRDVISNTIIPGPKWIHGYQVKQNEIPYFKQEELHFSVQ